LRTNDNPFAAAVLVGKLALQGKQLRNSKERDELLYGLKIQLSRDLFARKIAKKIYKLMLDRAKKQGIQKGKKANAKNDRNCY
jgi:hypothetical protein